MEKIETQEELATKETSESTEIVEMEETEESKAPESEEKPKEDGENLDYHTPEEDEKPKRSEKEKAEFTLKSVMNRYKQLGGDPADIVGVEDSSPAQKIDTSQFVTKDDFMRGEARKIARNEKEVDAIMAWVKKGLSLDEAHLLANKNRVKAIFSETERARVESQHDIGVGQKKPLARSPSPSNELLQQWSRSGLKYDQQTKTAKGKFNEVYWNGTEWSSRRIK